MPLLKIFSYIHNATVTPNKISIFLVPFSTVFNEKKELFGRERSGSKQGPSITFGCLAMEVLKVFSCRVQTYTDFSAIQGGWRAAEMRLKGKAEALRENSKKIWRCVLPLGWKTRPL